MIDNSTKKLSEQGKAPDIYAWLVFALSAAFLFYQYLVYIAPAMVTDQLIKTHHLSGFMLGLLVSVYFYSYMLMQIPAALLMDRFGARVVTSFALLCCALGILLFSSEALYVAFIGRFLIGLGAAFAALNYMKLASIWFPTAYFPLIASFFGVACMAGAGTAETPFAWLSNYLGWQHALYFCAAIGLALTALMALLLGSKRAEERHQALAKDHSFAPQAFRKLLKSPQQWALMIYSGFAFTPIGVFAGLWGTPYLMQAYDLSKFAAASSVSFAFFGFVCGGLIIDKLSKYLHSLVSFISLGTLLSLLILALIIYLPHLSYAILTLGIYLFGVCSSSYLAIYALARNKRTLHLTSASVALINMAGPLFAAMSEPLIGDILDMNSNHFSSEGVHMFSTHAYQMGLSVLLFYLFFALISCYFLRALDH